MLRLPRRLLAATPLLLLVASCSGAAPAPVRPPPPAPPPPAPPPPAPPPGTIGDACSSSEPFAQGSCGAGLLCAPLPGGYCTMGGGFGATCPDGAVRAESPRMGEPCLRRCASDADCRASEGYACDPGWGACMLPGLLSPALATCEAAAPLAARSFGPARQLVRGGHEAAGRYSMEPAAALLRDGTLVVAYMAQNGMAEPSNLGTVRILPDGTVDGPRVLRSERARHYDPWMASDAAGQVHLVWLGWNGRMAPELDMQIGLSSSADGVSWSAPVEAHAAEDCPGPGCMDKPMIAIGRVPGQRGLERMHVFYSVAGGPHEGLRATHADDGARTFGESVAVGGDAYGDVDVTPAGVLRVVYVTGEGRERLGSPQSRVELVASRDGGETWSAPVRVSAEAEPVPFFFSNAQVAADERRRVLYVAYPVGGPDGRWDIVLATSRDDGRTWARRKLNDDAPCANHQTPSLALDPRDGAVHAMWRENRGGVGRMVYAVCRRAGAECSPNEPLSDSPFASYGFVRHSTRWTGEYDVLLLDARRRVLHAVWTQTVDEGGLPTARLFHASRRLR